MPASSNVYVLSPGVLPVTGSAPVVINGGGIPASGVNGTAISGDNASRIFTVSSASNLSINSLELTSGNAGLDGNTAGPQASLDGGAILNQGKLTLSSGLITGNRTADSAMCAASCSVSGTAALSTGDAGSGGAIYNDGASGTIPQPELTITDSTFTHNSTGSGGAGVPGTPRFFGGDGAPGGTGGSGGSGGAIYSSGTLSVTGSSFSSNSTGSGGNAGDGGSGGSPLICFSTCNGGSGAAAGRAGDAGAGGAIFSSVSASGELALSTNPTIGKGLLTITESAITGNSTGNGGAGGNGGSGAAGVGGGGDGSATNGTPGGSANLGDSNASVLTTGARNAGGGIVIDAPDPLATVTATTISGNRSGDGRHGGDAGVAGRSTVPTNTAGSEGAGGNAGGLGVSDSTLVNPIVNIVNTTVAGNSTGIGGAPGTGGTIRRQLGRTAMAAAPRLRSSPS